MGRKEKKACERHFEKLGQESKGDRTSGEVPGEPRECNPLDRAARMSHRQYDIR